MPASSPEHVADEGRDFLDRDADVVDPLGIDRPAVPAARPRRPARARRAAKAPMPAAAPLSAWRLTQQVVAVGAESRAARNRSRPSRRTCAALRARAPGRRGSGGRDGSMSIGPPIVGVRAVSMRTALAAFSPAFVCHHDSASLPSGSNWAEPRGRRVKSGLNGTARMPLDRGQPPPPATN